MSVATSSEARHEVRRIRNVLIPLADGAELAASLYLPDAPGPHPALISYYPYRKDDLVGAGYEYARSELAAHGYASLLVDFRGTGSSSGVCTTTFDLRAEGRDGAQAVDWAGAQEWCDGNVGVWGMSYGGCMSLAIAAERPSCLRAIVPLFGSPDLYDHYVHPGGTENLVGNSVREAMMLAMDLAPPTHQDPKGRWLEVWRERMARLERGELHSLAWTEHKHFDAYWRRSTVDVEQIEVPAFLISGWNDVLLKGMTSAYERLPGAKRMVVGPWTHILPDVSPWEPFDWLAELRRWFDRWLRGIGDDGDAGEEDAPVTFFVQGSEEWRRASWPPAGIEARVLHLDAGGRLALDQPVESGGERYEAVATVGIRGGLWDPVGLGVGYPREQTPDDLRSLVYETEPVDHDVEIAGEIGVALHVALERGDELQLVAKLSHVSPQGASTLIASGWFNAAHRRSSSQSEPMMAGRVEEVAFSLWPTAFMVPTGHRLRLAVACADFPRIWPTPSSPTIRLMRGPAHPSRVVVPVIPNGARLGEPAEVPRPQTGVDRSPWLIEAGPTYRETEDHVTGERSVTIGNLMRFALPQGGEIGMDYDGTATARDADPSGARFNGRSRIRTTLPAGERVEVTARSHLTRDRMLLEARVTMEGTVLMERRWTSF